MSPLVRVTKDHDHDKLTIEIAFPKGTLAAAAFIPIVTAASLLELPPLPNAIPIEIGFRPPHVEATVPEHTDPRPIGPGVTMRTVNVVATTSTGSSSEPFPWDPARGSFTVQVPTR
jgi:hypothetical protein